MAGVPFEHLENLATVATARAARELLVRQSEFVQARNVVEGVLASRKHNLTREQFRAWHKAIRSGVMPAAVDPPSAAFADCWKSAAELASAEARLYESLHRELEGARRSLLKSAREWLPPYLVFAAESMRPMLAQLLENLPPAEPLPVRKKSTRARERHFLLYLQRLCAKNDTLSEFGPQGWGTAGAQREILSLAPEPGIAQREKFLERWTAHGAAAALNGDPEIRPELAPRIHPEGRIDGQNFIFTATGEEMPLTSEQLQILAACDGTTPAYSLGEKIGFLEKLAEEKFIRWEVEVPALEPHAFEVLVADVARWRDTPVRARWLEALAPIAGLPAQFAAAAGDPRSRFATIDEASDRLEQLGAHKSASRFLYSATNPIGEECFRECHFSIGQDLLDEVARDAAPWIDLWRDNYAFVAGRVAEGLRALLKQAPLRDGAIALPAFLRHCANLKMPLTGPALVALADNAFREVKAGFRETVASHADEPEYELTSADCHFVRRKFAYEKFDEYTYPSADLQLAARSVEAVRRGEYQWILAELHPSPALLHHGLYWSCPDKAALSRALTTIICGQPNVHFGFFATDFTATTAVRFFDALPQFTWFVSPQRGNPQWQTVPPSETEVFINEKNNDVALRRRGTQQYLGSFARGWIIPLGFHPFSFSLGKQTPRLRCGKVIVQRRAWVIAQEELSGGDFTGVSRDLVLAVERLRASRDLPRHIYIRPTEAALRRSGVEGRDKDTKPVYVDLESYLFLEIFHRWLNKAGELEATEMLPAPEDLLWQEADGRRTFELRTQILPR